MENKEIKNLTIAIWIPVIVAVISGIFSLFKARESAISKNQTDEIKVRIEQIEENLKDQNSIAKQNIRELKSLKGDLEQLPVGTIVASLLEPITFYRAVGDPDIFNKDVNKWCYADGRGISNTDYSHETGNVEIADLRGHFLRGLDPIGIIDKDGANRKLGDFQNDATKMPNSIFHTGNDGQHNHTYRSTDNGDLYDNKVSKVYTHPNFGGIGKPRYGEVKPKTTPGNEGTHSHAIKGGDDETRPKNIAVNYFIKINE